MTSIESVQNGRVKQWKKLQTKKERDKTKTFLVEGFHLVEEALKAGVALEVIVHSEANLPHTWQVDDINLYIVNSEILKVITETESPQGVVAICAQQKRPPTIDDMKTVLLVDEVQDPGNIGTMIRTADAAGFDAVILGEGCADVYNPKVVRSTQGSLFHLPVLKGNISEWMTQLQDVGVPIYGTALKNAVPYKEMDPQATFGLLVGNEGNGVNPQLLTKTDQNIYVPIFGQSESLNVAVAAGILMYALKI